MENKNKIFIDDLTRYRDKIKEVRESLGEKYNNDMNKDVVKLLRHAEHVIEDHIETLE
jgi:hypothetical protein